MVISMFLISGIYHNLSLASTNSTGKVVSLTHSVISSVCDIIDISNKAKTAFQNEDIDSLNSCYIDLKGLEYNKKVAALYNYMDFSISSSIDYLVEFKNNTADESDYKKMVAISDNSMRKETEIIQNICDDNHINMTYYDDKNTGIRHFEFKNTR